MRTLIHVEIVRACTAGGDGRPSGLVAAALDAIDAPVGRWIAEARTARVRELLVTTGRTLAEIADQLSYSDVSQLSREFRGVTGMAPGQWRAKTANGNTRAALGAGASRR